MNLFIFGNPALSIDDLAIKVAQQLEPIFPKIHFIFCESLTDILVIDEQELIILDVAQGIQKPAILHNLDDLETNHLTSLHDFDIAYFLKLLKSVDRIKKVTILALPQEYPQEKAKQWVQEQLKKLSQ